MLCVNGFCYCKYRRHRCATHFDYFARCVIRFVMYILVQQLNQLKVYIPVSDVNFSLIATLVGNVMGINKCSQVESAILIFYGLIILF